jgi:glycerophosphoryl diester phosphodiesterase
MRYACPRKAKSGACYMAMWLAMLGAGAATSQTPRSADTLKAAPALVGHRGLIHHAPENTLAGFAACLNLRLGFEVDIHRSKDGQLVCVHDTTLDRTTNGKGKLAALTLAELRKLDAGGWFHPAFRGERVPTLDEVLGLVAAHRAPPVGLPGIIALDVKITDDAVAEDIVRLAEKHGVTKRLVAIGHTISDAELRKRFRTASTDIGVAVLAHQAEDLPAALEERDADWAYIRFVPTPEQVRRIRDSGKRIFLVGPLVAGNEPENWRRARAAGVDAVLTDFPLECRRVWKEP